MNYPVCGPCAGRLWVYKNFPLCGPCTERLWDFPEFSPVLGTLPNFMKNPCVWEYPRVCGEFSIVAVKKKRWNQWFSNRFQWICACENALASLLSVISILRSDLRYEDTMSGWTSFRSTSETDLKAICYVFGARCISSAFDANWGQLDSWKSVRDRSHICTTSIFKNKHIHEQPDNHWKM